MEHFWINAAGLPAEITAQHPLTRRLCQDYEISPPQSPAVLTACAEPETAMRLADGAASPAYLEFLCIHDSLAAQLPAHHRFLMHGAAVAFDGAAYLFTAPSGTGKTTHVRLWRQYLGSRVTVVNGDKPFLSLEPDGTVRVWGSPWAGKERWQSPILRCLPAGARHGPHLPPAAGAGAGAPVPPDVPSGRSRPGVPHPGLSGRTAAPCPRVPADLRHDGRRRPLQL